MCYAILLLLAGAVSANEHRVLIVGEIDIVFFESSEYSGHTFRLLGAGIWGLALLRAS